MWWYTPAIPALRRLEKEGCGFEASLGYMVRACLKEGEEEEGVEEEGEEGKEKGWRQQLHKA